MTQKFTPLPEYPGPTSLAWQDPDTVRQIATGLEWPMVDDGAPKTRQDLIDTYGTAAPAMLRAKFALADDVALAERLAAKQPAVAA